MGFQLQHCLIQTFKDYCNNTSIHGFQYLVEPKRNKLEKFVWFVVLLTSIVSAVYIFLEMSKDFEKTPTVITLASATYPINDIEFPGVAICDNNRISKKAARAFARLRHGRLNLTEDELFDQLKYLGSLYDFSIRDVKRVMELYHRLELHRDWLAKNYEEILRVMLQLSPDCGETLVKCFWNADEVECNQIFSIKRTMNGFCCTFNYLMTEEKGFSTKRFKHHNVTINTTVLHTSGYETGLTVLVKSDLRDYYYPLQPMQGLNVFIFRPHEYPDMYTGGLTQSDIPLQNEVFIKIKASKIEAVDALSTKTALQRDCILNSDREPEFFLSGVYFDRTRYTQANCIINCKVDVIFALCDCVPFFIPISDKYKYRKQACTLADITCLNKLADKVMTLYPETDDEDLKFEQGNSLWCPACLPACEFTNYDVTNDYMFLSVPDGILSGLDPRQHSLIHIYYDSEESELYSTDLYYYWFDQISNLGGLCGLFLGFSIISIIEFAYFFTIHFLSLLIKTRTKDRPKSSVSDITTISNQLQQNIDPKDIIGEPISDMW